MISGSDRIRGSMEDEGSKDKYEVAPVSLRRQIFYYHAWWPAEAHAAIESM